MTTEALPVNVLRAGDKEENRRQCLPKRGLQSTIREPRKHFKILLRTKPEMYSRLMGGEKGSTYLFQGKNHREKIFFKYNHEG